MSDDNECSKCGGYSGGASLCIPCEKSAVDQAAKKPRRKKASPAVSEMMAALEECVGVLEGPDVEAEIANPAYRMAKQALEKARKEFK